MALLTVQNIAKTGLEPTYGAASTADTFLNNGRTFIHIKNGDASSHTITVDSLVNCNQGVDHNVAVAVPAGEERMIGVFEPSRFNNAQGIVSYTLDDATSVTVAIVSLP